MGRVASSVSVAPRVAPRTVRRVFAVAAAVGVACLPVVARGADAPVVPAAPVPDPYAPPVRVPPLTGPAVLVRHDLAGDLVLRTKGRVTHRLVVTGTLPPGMSVPDRSFDGSVDLVRRVRLVAAKRTSTIEGPFVVTGRWGGDPPKSATVPLSLSFEEGPRGAAAIPSIRFAAPGISVDDLEALQRAFTDRFGPPDRAVRVGDAFTPLEGMGVEDTLLRVAFRLSQRQLTGRAPVLPVPEGAVWVDGLVGQGPDAALVVRAAITHVHAADTDDAKAPENVHVDLRAAIEARRALVLDGGWASSHELALRRRLRFTGKGFDYTVEVVQQVDFVTVRERPAEGPHDVPPEPGREPSK